MDDLRADLADAEQEAADFHASQMKLLSFFEREAWPLGRLLHRLAGLGCQDFPDSTCDECDGTGLWCDPCLARESLKQVGFKF